MPVSEENEMAISFVVKKAKKHPGWIIYLLATNFRSNTICGTATAGQGFDVTFSRREAVRPYVRPLSASLWAAGLDEVRGTSSQTTARTLGCVGIIGLSRVGLSSRGVIVIICTLVLSARCG
jgi:hypothetical protein